MRSSTAPSRTMRVLVIDDDEMVIDALKAILQRAGCSVVGISDSVEGLVAAVETGFDVAVVDINMPNVTGMELLKEVKAKRPETEVVMMTAFATVKTAVEAVKAGAYHYLTKPFESVDEVRLTIQKAFEHKLLLERNRQLEGMLVEQERFEGLVGRGPKMEAVFRLIGAVAPSSATVLIGGESGTGKELVARALHFKSPRSTKPLVAVNCSALTETLLESELFGHVRGAFTGAVTNKKGLFEEADGGTLFLDEIGDVPAATQVRLLRALQEGEIKRVGSNEVTRVDVRMIAATNKDLLKCVAEGSFREDLYYRLNVISINLPPLRERPEDLPLLVRHFLEKFAAKMGKRLERVEPQVMRLFEAHRWTGNVRELENIIERAAVLAQGPVLTLAELPEGFGTSRSDDLGDVAVLRLPYAQAKALVLRTFERKYLLDKLVRARGNISQAANAAGTDRSNFRRLMRQFKVDHRALCPVEPDSDDAELDAFETSDLEPAAMGLPGKAAVGEGRPNPPPALVAVK